MLKAAIIGHEHHEYGAKVPDALMTTHKHALALLHMASTALMSTHSTMVTYFGGLEVVLQTFRWKEANQVNTP